MDVVELAKLMNDLIDLQYLARELQRQPVVVRDDGSWRAMSEGEARTIGRLVGEAIGVRLADPTDQDGDPR